jgi:hypothetical protein
MPRGQVVVDVATKCTGELTTELLAGELTVTLPWELPLKNSPMLGAF